MRICRYLHPDLNAPALGAVTEEGWVHRLESNGAPFPDMDGWLADPNALECAREAVSKALDADPFARLWDEPFILLPGTNEVTVNPVKVELNEEARIPADTGEAPTLRRMDARYRMEGNRLLPLMPVQNQEIWGAGVTYERSKVARMEESVSGGSFYDLVYSAERPELFFKSTPARSVGPGEQIRIRRDSTWDVPEPELALVINATGQIVGYTVGNDVSSRSIEGENPLYLPQAKLYDGCCALGPMITLAGEGGIEDPRDLTIRLRIHRGEDVAFEGEVSTSRMRRDPNELAEYLFRDNSFPRGVLLLTGTGIVPPDEFTLQSGDRVEIAIDRIGTLINTVA